MSPDNLNQRLEEARPKLSQAEQAELWQKVSAATHAPVAVPSPYVSFVRSRSVAVVALVLMVTLGTSTTVAASNLAKPGDLLFPIERAIERTQLALASEERAAELRTIFTDERLAELESIITEEAKDSDTDAGQATSTVLVTEEGELRISKAVNELLDHVEDFDDSATRDAYIMSLLARIDTVAVEGRDRVRTDDKRKDIRTEDSRMRIDDDRVEVREDGYRIRIDKDGEVRIKASDDSRDDDSNDDSRDDSGSRDIDSDDSSGRGRDDDSSDDSFDAWDDSDSRVEEEDEEDSSGRGRGGDDDRDEDDEDEEDDKDEDKDSSGSGSGKDDEDDKTDGSN